MARAQNPETRARLPTRRNTGASCTASTSSRHTQPRAACACRSPLESANALCRRARTARAARARAARSPRAAAPSKENKRPRRHPGAGPPSLGTPRRGASAQRAHAAMPWRRARQNAVQERGRGAGAAASLSLAPAAAGVPVLAPPPPTPAAAHGAAADTSPPLLSPHATRGSGVARRAPRRRGKASRKRAADSTPRRAAPRRAAHAPRPPPPSAPQLARTTACTDIARAPRRAFERARAVDAVWLPICQGVPEIRSQSASCALEFGRHCHVMPAPP